MKSSNRGQLIPSTKMKAFGEPYLTGNVELIDVGFEVVDLGRKDMESREVEAARMHRGCCRREDKRQSSQERPDNIPGPANPSSSPSMRCRVNEVANVGSASLQSLEDWPRLLAFKKFSHSLVIDCSAT